MSDDVKERVARAIYAAYAGDPDDCDVDELSRVSMDVAKDDAHAALSALRPGDEIDLGEFGTVVLVPKEDDTRPFSDSELPSRMIDAGMDILDQVDRDNAEYVAGVTTDWDQGMVVVAIYRAMLAAVKEPTNDRP